MGIDLPSREPGDKEGATQRPEQRPYRYAPVQQTFGKILTKATISKNLYDRLNVDSPEVNHAVSEVERRKADVQDDQLDFQRGLIGHSLTNQRIRILAHLNLIDI